MPIPDSEIHAALFQLSHSIAGHSDLETLCKALDKALRRVISFDFLALVLHDSAHNLLRFHAVSSNHPYQERERALSTSDASPGAWVWHEQKPLVLKTLEELHGAGGTLREAIEHGMQAITLVPLSNGSRRLGLLAFGFRQPFAPGAEMLAFLERVASEVAVTVEGYLTRQALLRERDRMQVLFDITNALISKRPMEELFAAISTQLARVVAHDFAVTTLLDKATGEIRLESLHAPDGSVYPMERTSSSPEGLPAGEVLASGKPVVVASPDFKRFSSPIYRKFASLGFQSGCCIPLLSSNGILGALDLARKNGEPFTPDEVDLLEQVGRQIAIATENSLAFREISEMRDKLATEKLYLEDEIRTDQNMGSMIGESPAFQAVLRSIQVVAPTGATVLIQGETGTGKELVARAIHEMSERSRRSFIKVNCAAIPATLLESELFGHEKGSFTGAFAQKIGRFELAHQGTLFLDEIGEIPLELQSKLLRAIQEQEFERLGGNRTIRTDIRIIAATNRNLKQMVDQGRFRSDLYYRLHVFPLFVPPLRERKEDIPLLLRFFTQKHARRLNRPIDSIPSAALAALTGYSWPGNIREMQNLVERSVIISQGPVLEIALPEALPAIAVPPPAPPPTRKPDGAERERILAALRESGGKVSGSDGAAARLGMRRTTLQSRMKRLGIERLYR